MNAPRTDQERAIYFRVADLRRDARWLRELRGERNWQANLAEARRLEAEADALEKAATA